MKRLISISKYSIAAFTLVFLCACVHAPKKPTVGSKRSALRVDKALAIPNGVEANHIVKTAKSHLGTPYRYGGNSSKGADCSGFTQMVFGKFGIRLPHSSYLQSQYGEFISTSKSLKKGDLVFFETYKKGPSHVGIYLGDQRFIHSSSGRKGVIISSLFSSYYGPRFLGGKRLFL